MKNTIPYHELRDKLFSIYQEELNRGRNREAALVSAMDYLDELVHKNDIRLRKSFIEGVRSELIFYHVYREELNLKPTPWDIDKYLHIDFSGKHPKTGKRILLDVTKNPKIKLEKADNVE